MATQSHNSHCSLPSFIALPSCLLVLASIVLQPALASVELESILSPEFNVSNPNATLNWTFLDDNSTLKHGHIKHSKYSIPTTIFMATVFLIVIIGTIIGNVLVCVAVRLVRKLRRPSNYLIVSLAVSDLCVACIVMPVATVYDIMGTWPFGPVICDFWVSSDVLSCTASILNLCMISVDRYYAITKPLEYGVKRTPRRMLFCVFIVWVSAAFISLPPVLILGNEKTETSCSVSQNQAYQIYATFGSFYIPLTVMVVVYYKIFRAARKIVKDEKRAQSHLETHCYLEINVKNGGAAEAKLLGNQPTQPPPRGSTASTNTTNAVHQKKLRFQLAKERKASTTLGIIMSAFVICWLPFFVLALLRPFVKEDAIPDAVSALFLWLGYLNSLLNPVIYATLNRDFRKPFQEILFFRCGNLNHMMREEFYHSQYGDPDQHYCVNTHTTKMHNYDEGVEIVSAVDREETRASESFL
nr:5-hydroxytryptamine receptor 7 short variant [Mythimna separata]